MHKEVQMKLISIMTACYNEEENVQEVYEAVKAQFSLLPQYAYEHISAIHTQVQRRPLVVEKERINFNS